MMIRCALRDIKDIKEESKLLIREKKRGGIMLSLRLALRLVVYYKYRGQGKCEEFAADEKRTRERALRR